MDLRSDRRAGGREKQVSRTATRVPGPVQAPEVSLLECRKDPVLSVRGRVLLEFGQQI